MKLLEINNATPDLPKPLTGENCYDLYKRTSFRVGTKTFNQLEPGEYKYNNITVYCDQQDSTSWAARVGSVSTGYYWTPEWAVLELFDALESE